MVVVMVLARSVCVQVNDGNGTSATSSGGGCGGKSLHMLSKMARAISFWKTYGELCAEAGMVQEVEDSEEEKEAKKEKEVKKEQKVKEEEGVPRKIRKVSFVEKFRKMLEEERKEDEQESRKKESTRMEEEDMRSRRAQDHEMRRERELRGGWRNQRGRWF